MRTFFRTTLLSIFRAPLVRILGVCERTVISRIASGKLRAWQVCKGAPWVIKADDLSREWDPAQPSLFDVGSDDGTG